MVEISLSGSGEGSGLGLGLVTAPGYSTAAFSAPPILGISDNLARTGPFRALSRTRGQQEREQHAQARG